MTQKTVLAEVNSIILPPYMVQLRGYIFVTWLTDPSWTSSIALIALEILLYFFLMYREIYDNNKSITTGSSCKEKWKQSVLYIPPCAVVVFILEFIVYYL